MSIRYFFNLATSGPLMQKRTAIKHSCLTFNMNDICFTAGPKTEKQMGCLSLNYARLYKSNHDLLIVISYLYRIFLLCVAVTGVKLEECGWILH